MINGTVDFVKKRRKKKGQQKSLFEFYIWQIMWINFKSVWVRFKTDQILTSFIQF